MKISLVVFKIANPSNGVHGRVEPPLSSWIIMLMGTIFCLPTDHYCSL